MHPSLLQNISQPSDLKRLNSAQIQQLCGEIRQFLLDSVSKTGGHLASNLGAVELTVALHRIFETPGMRSFSMWAISATPTNC